MVPTALSSFWVHSAPLIHHTLATLTFMFLSCIKLIQALVKANTFPLKVQSLCNLCLTTSRTLILGGSTSRTVWIHVCLWGGVGGDVCSINGAAAHKLAKQESLPSEKGWCKGGKMWQMPMSKALDFLPHASFLWWWSNRMESKWHQGNYQ